MGERERHGLGQALILVGLPVIAAMCWWENLGYPNP